VANFLFISLILIIFSKRALGFEESKKELLERIANLERRLDGSKSNFITISIIKMLFHVIFPLIFIKIECHFILNFFSGFPRDYNRGIREWFFKTESEWKKINLSLLFWPLKIWFTNILMRFIYKSSENLNFGFKDI